MIIKNLEEIIRVYGYNELIVSILLSSAVFIFAYLIFSFVLFIYSMRDIDRYRQVYKDIVNRMIIQKETKQDKN